MNNVRIAEVLDLIADLLEFQDANPFRVRAYRNGARAIRDYPQPMAAMLADPDRKLTDIAGRGQGPGRKSRHALRDRHAAAARGAASPGAAKRADAAAHSRPGAQEGGRALQRTEDLDARSAARPPARRSRCASSRVSAPRPKKPSWPAWRWRKPPADRMFWADADQYAQAIRAHLRSVPEHRSSSKWPAAIAAARTRSAIWTFWSCRRTSTR